MGWMVEHLAAISRPCLTHFLILLTLGTSPKHGLRRAEKGRTRLKSAPRATPATRRASHDSFTACGPLRGHRFDPELTLGQCWPTLAEFGPSLIAPGPNLAEVGRTRPSIGRTWSHVGRSRPESAESGQMCRNNGRTRPDFDRRRPALAPCGPMSASTSGLHSENLHNPRSGTRIQQDKASQTCGHTRKVSPCLPRHSSVSARGSFDITTPEPLFPQLGHDPAAPWSDVGEDWRSMRKLVQTSNMKVQVALGGPPRGSSSGSVCAGWGRRGGHAATTCVMPQRSNASS